MTTEHTPTGLGIGYKLGKNTYLGTPKDINTILAPLCEIDKVQAGDYALYTRISGEKMIIQVMEVNYESGQEGKMVIKFSDKQGNSREGFTEYGKIEKFSIGEFVTFQISGVIKQKKIIDLRDDFMVMVGGFGQDSMDIPLDMISKLPIFNVGDNVLIPRNNGTKTIARIMHINYSDGILSVEWYEKRNKKDKLLDIGVCEESI